MSQSLPRISFLITMAFVVSCSPAPPTDSVTPTPVLSQTRLPVLADEELAEAVRQAQETLHVWRQEFLAPRQPYSMTSLKVRFGEGGIVEDIWTEPLYVLDDIYTVRMVEGVTVEQGIHPEHLVDVRPEEIVDWMLLKDDGTLIGGYTIRLEYGRMTPEQQKRFLEITGYRFE